MKKMLTVMAGIVAAGSLMSSIARADVILGEDKSTWSPYPIEVTANSDVRVGEDESTWSPYPIEGQTDGKYSYSISLDKAITQKEMKDLIMEATEKEKSGS